MLISEVAKIVIFELNLDYPAPETPPQLTWTFFLCMLFCQGVYYMGTRISCTLNVHNAGGQN